MSKIEDGGPAFPLPEQKQIIRAHGIEIIGNGMSLRDWFAGQALAGMNASPALLETVTSAEAGTGSHYERLTRHAYKQADAMLAARKTEGKE